MARSNFQIDIEPNTLFTFEEYKAFIKTVKQRMGHRHLLDSRSGYIEMGRLVRAILFDMPAIYRTKLPTYLLAYCPYCGGRVSEAIDTFSLSGVGWAISEPRGFGWFGRQIKNAGGRFTPLSYSRHPHPSYTAECDHVRAVIYGVNLNKIIPDDINPVSFTFISSEKPGLLTPFMNLAGSYAVIHTLPVGRLDDPIWQPRYTAYFITYFNEDPQAFMKALAPLNPHEHRHFFWPYDKMDYNLIPWLESGHLFWLGPKPISNPATPPASPWGEEGQDLYLRQTPISDFPYGNMDGLTGRWVADFNTGATLLPNLDSVSIYNTQNLTRVATAKKGQPLVEQRRFKKLYRKTN